ncbi:MAG: hypothetical protein M3Z25_04675 [Actinomycetota bacterium]|nr:hypothetical protein [Actinomycetota bacterium]
MRLTLLAALCTLRASEITDALVELLIGLMHRINARPDRRVERELTADLRRVCGKETIHTVPMESGSTMVVLSAW